MPIIYAKGKVMLITTPSYILLQNLVTVPGRADLSELGENRVYATLTAKYTFQANAKKRKRAPEASLFFLLFSFNS